MSKIKRVIEIEEEHIKELQDYCKGKPYVHLSFKIINSAFSSIAQSKPYDDSGDLISREALKDAIENQDKFACLPDTTLVPFRMLNEPEKNYEPYVHLKDIRNAIDNAPTVHPRDNFDLGYVKGLEDGKPKQGEWIKHIDNLFPEESTEECPFCHEEQRIVGNDDNFCPSCGADMKGGAE